MIIPHGKYYYIFYKKHHAKDGDHPIGMTTYSPPKPGGAFLLNSNAIDAWQVLGEFAYIKMLITVILDKRNQVLQASGHLKVGHGPISHELRNIKYARKFFRLTKSLKVFVKAFMNVNSMSLVAYPVGQHNDHFNAGGESPENKITFIIKGVAGRGRGGSLFDNGYVFALLDWQHTTRTARKFYVTHAQEMGLGPIQSSGAQRILDDFFENGGRNGRSWKRLFNKYMSNS